MSVLRVFPGRNDQKWQILDFLRYITDISKHIWMECEIPSDQLVHAYGISTDPTLAADEILGLHQAFGNPGKRYFYHVLLDFSAESVDPWQAASYGWEISEYLRRAGLQYLQGVHCTKGNGIDHPHVHWIINALYPLTGKKFHIDFSFIRNFKIFINNILYTHQVPLIVLGQKSLPFYIQI